MAMPLSSFVAQDLGKLFEPDVILPAQFYTMFKCSQYKEPERRLMVAVLEDAVSCLSMNPRECNLRQRRQYEEARQWVNAEEDSEWIFSFRNICEVLGIDPSYLRRGLTRGRTASSVVNRNVMASARRRQRVSSSRSRSLHKKIRLRTGS
jgi:hypothetical protein